mmetsp:Transcript_9390/g.27904  ORF Transcript_9390/g.27904 Transcript_9390/m.27904 type:complete len:256 (+) Transcript_9390:145-912(+)
MADPIFQALGLKEERAWEPAQAGWSQQQWPDYANAGCPDYAGYLAAEAAAAAAAMPWLHSTMLHGNLATQGPASAYGSSPGPASPEASMAMLLASQHDVWAEGAALQQEWDAAMKLAADPALHALLLPEMPFQEGAPAFISEPHLEEDSARPASAGGDSERGLLDAVLPDSQGAPQSGRAACQWGAVGTRAAKSPPATPPSKQWEEPASGTPAKIPLRCGNHVVSLADRVPPPQFPSKLISDPWLPQEHLGWTAA